MGKRTGEEKIGCGPSSNKGTTYENEKEQGGQEEEVKDNYCGEMKETKSDADHESYRFSTNLNSTFKMKEEGKCSSVTSSVKSKRSSKNGPECHSSQEAFKRGLEEPSDLEEIGDCQCNTSYVEFLKSGKKENNDTPKMLSPDDPTQVISKCTQYANRSEEKPVSCAEVSKKIHKDHSPSKHQSSSIMATLRQSRRFQLLSRWAPSAAVYLAATTAITFWVTEWKDPIKLMKKALGAANK